MGRTGCWCALLVMAVLVARSLAWFMEGRDMAGSRDMGVEVPLGTPISMAGGVPSFSVEAIVKVGDSLNSSARIFDGLVYVVSGKWLICLEESSGRVVWNYTSTFANNTGFSAPAVNVRRGSVVVTGINTLSVDPSYQITIAVLDARTGEVWGEVTGSHCSYSRMLRFVAVSSAHDIACFGGASNVGGTTCYRLPRFKSDLLQPLSRTVLHCSGGSAQPVLWPSGNVTIAGSYGINVFSGTGAFKCQTETSCNLLAWVPRVISALSAGTCVGGRCEFIHVGKISGVPDSQAVQTLSVMDADSLVISRTTNITWVGHNPSGGFVIPADRSLIVAAHSDWVAAYNFSTLQRVWAFKRVAPFGAPALSAGDQFVLVNYNTTLLLALDIHTGAIVASYNTADPLCFAILAGSVSAEFGFDTGGPIVDRSRNRVYLTDIKGRLHILSLTAAPTPSPTTAAPTPSPTTAPTTRGPSSAPSTRGPSAAPTTAPTFKTAPMGTLAAAPIAGVFLLVAAWSGWRAHAHTASKVAPVAGLTRTARAAGFVGIVLGVADVATDFAQFVNAYGDTDQVSREVAYAILLCTSVGILGVAWRVRQAMEKGRFDESLTLVFVVLALEDVPQVGFSVYLADAQGAWTIFSVLQVATSMMSIAWAVIIACSHFFEADAARQRVSLAVKS